MSEVQKINLRLKPWRGVWQRCAKKETLRLMGTENAEVISPHRVRMGVKENNLRWVRLFNETMREITLEYDTLIKERDAHLTKVS